jgi:hypothetical protein
VRGAVTTPASMPCDRTASMHRRPKLLAARTTTRTASDCITAFLRLACAYFVAISASISFDRMMSFSSGSAAIICSIVMPRFSAVSSYSCVERK